jgi:hypothetical protein
MPSILNLLGPHAIAQPQAERVTGTVSLNQPAPTSFQSPLYVLIDGWSTDNYVKVSRWLSCNGLALPQPGAAVVLFKDSVDTQADWVCVWWDGIVPTATGAHGTTTGYIAGTGTTMTVDGASTGGLGTTAYTHGDLVLALKQLGVLPH